MMVHSSAVKLVLLGFNVGVTLGFSGREKTALSELAR